MFLAQRVEYLGLEYMKFAGALALGAVIGTVVLVVLAIRVFRHSGALDAVLAVGCLAASPFLVEWLLRINGTELNIHGVAILGYFLWALGSEICAAGILIALVVRTAMRWKSRRDSSVRESV